MPLCAVLLQIPPTRETTSFLGKMYGAIKTKPTDWDTASFPGLFVCCLLLRLHFSCWELPNKLSFCVWILTNNNNNNKSYLSKLCPSILFGSLCPDTVCSLVLIKKWTVCVRSLFDLTSPSSPSGYFVFAFHGRDLELARKGLDGCSLSGWLTVVVGV